MTGHRRWLAFLPAAAVVLAGGSSGAVVQGHEGDLVLSGNEARVITGDFRQVGDIRLSDSASLTMRNGTFTVARKPGDPRAEIGLSGSARLIVENAALVPTMENPGNLHLTAIDTSSIELTGTTFINVVNLVGDARLTARGSSIYSSAPRSGIPEEAGAFGIVQVCCSVCGSFEDTTVGSVGLFFGGEQIASLDGLRPACTRTGGSPSTSAPARTSATR